MPYSDETLIDGMRELASELGRKPKQKEMRKEGPYSINAYKRAFGSWNEAIEQAGFEPRQTSKGLDSEALLDALQELANELDKTPTQEEVNDLGKYSVGAYYSHFGSLNDAKRELDLPLNKENNVERVTVECAQCGKEIERLPSKVEQAEYTFCSQECHYEHNTERYSGDGNPRSTLKEVPCDYCGDPLQRAKWKREFQDNHFCNRCCMAKWRTEEKHPQWTEYPELECEYCGRTFKAKPSVADERRFCSRSCWYDARDYTGENNPMWDGGPVEKECTYCGDPYHVKESEAPQSKYCSPSCRMSNRTGEDHPTYIGGHDSLYYGPNWVEQRRKALIRDQARCQADDCSLTDKDHLEIYGNSLDVHHIEPLREFLGGENIDHESANDLNNLLTLCREHHRKYDSESSHLGARRKMTGFR